MFAGRTIGAKMITLRKAALSDVAMFSFMNRPIQHQIDDKAESIFRSLIPTSWVKRAQHPDYGLDFNVEIDANSALTGLTFFVQLKGTRGLRYRGSNISFPIKTKHLKYYVDKCRQPVFLVLVDTSRGDAFWCFLQGYVADNLTNGDWRSKASITVKIPSNNQLSQTELLRDAVAAAADHMAASHPSSIKHSMIAKKRQLESLDSRFDAIVRAIDGVCEVELRAREAVSITMRFCGEPARVSKAVEDFLERGRPVVIEPGLVEVSGSPLIEEIFRNSGVMQQLLRANLSVTFSAVDLDGNERATLSVTPAVIEGGVRELRLRAELERAPFAFQFTIDATQANGSCTEGKYSFPISRWVGQPLCQLAHFDGIHKLFSELRLGCVLNIEAFFEGNRLFHCTAKPDALTSTRETAEFLDVIKMARELSRYFGVNPRFPENLRADDLDGIRILHWAMISKERRPAVGWKINSKSAVGTLRKIPEDWDKSPIGQIRLTNEPKNYVLFGQPIIVPAFNWQFTRIRMISPISLLLTSQPNTDESEIEIEWEGLDGAEMYPCMP
jgi:uncharacterized protein DUF4365